VVVAASGVFLAWLMYGRRPVDPAAIGVPRTAVHKLLLNKYYVDEIYDALIVQPLYRASLWLARVFDPKVDRRPRQRRGRDDPRLGPRPATAPDGLSS